MRLWVLWAYIKTLAIWQRIWYTCHMAKTKGVTMMEEELRQLLKDQGWNLFRRTRRGKEYFYAQKWMRGEKYIAPVTRLDQITQDQVLAKIK
jgi:hypothetical protein